MNTQAFQNPSNNTANPNASLRAYSTGQAAQFNNFAFPSSSSPSPAFSPSSAMLQNSQVFSPNPAQGNPWGFLPAEMSNIQQAYGSPQEFWDHVGRMTTRNLELQAMGAVPDEKANQEEWNQFWRKLGCPERPDAYRLPTGYTNRDMPPDLALGVGAIMDEGRNEFMQLAHAAHLTQKQAETLYALAGDSVARNLASQPAATAGSSPSGPAASPSPSSTPVNFAGPSAGQDDPYQVVQQLWPQDTARNLDLAKRGARSLGIGTALDEAGLSSHPLVLQMAWALGKATAEDGMQRPGQADAALPVGDAAYKELLRVVATDAYKRQEPGSVALAEQLSVRVNMDK